VRGQAVLLLWGDNHLTPILWLNTSEIKGSESLSIAAPPPIMATPMPALIVPDIILENGFLNSKSN